eukprot:g28493.t1
MLTWLQDLQSVQLQDRHLADSVPCGVALRSANSATGVAKNQPARAAASPLSRSRRALQYVTLQVHLRANRPKLLAIKDEFVFHNPLDLWRLEVLAFQESFRHQLDALVLGAREQTRRLQSSESCGPYSKPQRGETAVHPLPEAEHRHWLLCELPLGFQDRLSEAIEMEDLSHHPRQLSLLHKGWSVHPLNLLPDLWPDRRRRQTRVIPISFNSFIAMHAARHGSPNKGAEVTPRTSHRIRLDDCAAKHCKDGNDDDSDGEDGGPYIRRLSEKQYEALVRCAQQVVALSGAGGAPRGTI